MSEKTEKVVNMADRQAAQGPKQAESAQEPRVDLVFTKADHLNTAINHANIQIIRTPDGVSIVSLICGELQSEYVDDAGKKSITILPKAILRMDLTFALRLIEMLNQNYPNIEEALQVQQERNTPTQIQPSNRPN